MLKKFIKSVLGIDQHRKYRSYSSSHRYYPKKRYSYSSSDRYRHNKYQNHQRYNHSHYKRKSRSSIFSSFFSS